MNKERAIEVIEDLRDYAYENWDEIEYEKELDEVGEAVDLIKSMLGEGKSCGTAEINGKKYIISEVQHE